MPTTVSAPPYPSPAAAASTTPRTAPRLDLLGGEGAFEVVARARALQASGHDVLQLAIGEPDFPTPPHVVEAGLEALRAGQTRYVAPEGIPALRATIAASLALRGVPASAEQVVVTPGAKAALFYSLLALVAPGDEVLIPDPGFPIYRSVTRFAGGVPVAYGLRAETGFTPNVDEIATLITPRTRVLVLNAPHNPTGGSVDAAALERLAALAQRHDQAVVSDEIYGRLRLDGDDDAFTPSLAGLPGMSERTIIVDGFSKTYAMTGWRLGYAALPAAIAGRVATLAVNAHSCVPHFVQTAGVAALTGPDEPVRAMVAELRRRRDAVVRALAAIPGVSCPTPAGAFYAFPSLAAVLVPRAISAAAMADLLLTEYGVALLPGTAFGARGEHHLRLALTAPVPVLERAVARLASGVRAVITRPSLES
ncbi:MAG: pyridoxal phosphate-dependent aminotransferase [Gemmatimonadaceae bacterium]